MHVHHWLIVVLTVVLAGVAAMNVAARDTLEVPAIDDSNYRQLIDSVRNQVRSGQGRGDANAVIDIDINAIEDEARCGRTLEVRPGTRSSDLSLQLDCSQDAPLIIHAGPTGDVFFTESSSVMLAGEYIQLAGFEFNGGGVVISGSHNRITDNRFVGSESTAIQLRARSARRSVASRFNLIDNNEITGFRQQGIEVNLHNDANLVQYNWIFGNSVHDIDESVSGNGHESIRVLTDAYQSSFTLIEANTLRNVWVRGEPEAVSVKSAGVYVVGNTMDSPRSQIVLRESQASMVIDNTIIQGDIRVYGRGHLIRGNSLLSGDIILPSGEQSFDAPVCRHKPVPCSPDGKSAHTVAESVHVQSNQLQEGDIIVGECLGFECPQDRAEWSLTDIRYPQDIHIDDNSKAARFVNGTSADNDASVDSEKQ